jgi:hypothetical protein
MLSCHPRKYSPHGPPPTFAVLNLASPAESLSPIRARLGAQPRQGLDKQVSGLALRNGKRPRPEGQEP